MPEGMPKFQELLISAEQQEAFQAGQINLLDIYGNHEVTFKGITAPLNNLVALCPVPKDEMDTQKINNWTANILIESGQELPESITAFVDPETAKKK